MLNLRGRAERLHTGNGTSLNFIFLALARNPVSVHHSDRRSISPFCVDLLLKTCTISHQVFYPQASVLTLTRSLKYKLVVVGAEKAKLIAHNANGIQRQIKVMEQNLGTVTNCKSLLELS